MGIRWELAAALWPAVDAAVSFQQEADLAPIVSAGIQREEPATIWIRSIDIDQAELLPPHEVWEV
jgi:hypothetical protein